MVHLHVSDILIILNEHTGTLDSQYCKKHVTSCGGVSVIVSNTSVKAGLMPDVADT